MVGFDTGEVFLILPSSYNSISNRFQVDSTADSNGTCTQYLFSIGFVQFFIDELIDTRQLNSFAFD